MRSLLIAQAMLAVRSSLMEAFVNTLMQDLRFALRQMRRSPGFAVTAVAILALGIAANVIVFGVIQAMVLQHLNLPHTDQVITFAPHQNGYPIFSYPEVRDVRDGNESFSAVAAVDMNTFGLDADGTTKPIWGCEVSGQYFEVTGIQPLLGRLLGRADDDHPGASDAVVLSWPAWKNLFGADPKIVGKAVRINKRPYTIVGVTPKGFYGTEKFLQPDVFVPMANEGTLDGVNWLNDRNTKMVFPIARMRDGVTVAQAQAELNAIALRVRKLDPKAEDGVQFWLAYPGLIGNFVRNAAMHFLGGILGLAGIVLLAACANLGSLFAARTADRAREIAIRVALGSSRWRILRQVILEAVVISVMGGACACALSWIALTGLAQWSPPTDYPIKFQVEPQPSLILIAFVVSLVAGVVFGLMPLRQILKADPNEAIKAGNQGGSQASGGRKWALRDLLLTAQIALCCVTVTAAFVSVRGLSKALSTEIGILPKDATLTKFDLSQASYTAESGAQFQQQLQQKIAHLPGVEAVGYSNATPLADSLTTLVFSQQTTDFRTSNQAFETFAYNISPDYFAAAGTRLIAGRDLLATDTAKTPMVAVINKQFARSLFHLSEGHLADAVGRSFKNAQGVSIRIVGMVADGKYFLTSEDSQEAVFFSILQQPGTLTSLLVRMRPSAPGLAAAEMVGTLRKLLHDLDPAIPIRSSGTWTTQLAFSFFPAQVATLALSLFGVFGLLLSITGTFGLASYTVSKRMRDLSIRVALGAQGKQVLSAALGRMFKLMLAGAVIGMGLGLAAGHLLAHIVYQATAQDPFVLVSVTFTILLTGLLSVAGPTRRALHVDPADLLREQ